MNETPNQEVIFDLDYLVLAAEAVLFANGSAIGFDKLAASLEVDEDKVPEILGALKKRYDERETAIELIIMRDCAVLATKSRYRDIVRHALELRKNQPLSKAALEVLAVIAYHQPVTRAFIDKVRGVESPSVVSTLAEKGLIEEKGRLDAPGRPVLYGTTPVFLRTFGLASVDELRPPVVDAEFADENGKIIGTADFLAEEESAVTETALSEVETDYSLPQDEGGMDTGSLDGEE